MERQSFSDIAFEKAVHSDLMERSIVLLENGKSSPIERIQGITGILEVMYAAQKLQMERANLDQTVIRTAADFSAKMLALLEERNNAHAFSIETGFTGQFDPQDNRTGPHIEGYEDKVDETLMRSHVLWNMGVNSLFRHLRSRDNDYLERSPLIKIEDNLKSDVVPNSDKYSPFELKLLKLINVLDRVTDWGSSMIGVFNTEPQELEDFLNILMDRIGIINQSFETVSLTKQEAEFKNIKLPFPVYDGLLAALPDLVRHLMFRISRATIDQNPEELEPVKQELAYYRSLLEGSHQTQ